MKQGLATEQTRILGVIVFRHRRQIRPERLWVDKIFRQEGREVSTGTT